MLEQTFKNFAIDFTHTDSRTTFCSGDLVAGHVSFDLPKATNISSISVELRGRTHVHWSTGGGGKKRRRRHYSAELDHFILKSVISPASRGAVNESTSFPSGTHKYPFSCQIPYGDFPSTFKGIHGGTTYILTVSIHRPWHMAKEFCSELNFVKYTDIRRPDLWLPLSGTNRMTQCCLWCASGPITLTVSVGKKLFTAGETVKVDCGFSNTSSREVTPKVKLLQKQVYYTHSRANRSSSSRSLVSVTGQPISANTADVHTEISLTIPTDVELTSSTCTLLDIDYMIEVSLCATAFPDVTVLFPIIICPAPVNPVPVNPAPVNPAPVNPAPVNPAPVNPEPVNPAPVNPAPVNPPPVNPDTSHK